MLSLARTAQNGDIAIPVCLLMLCLLRVEGILHLAKSPDQKAWHKALAVHECELSWQAL